jgi:MFS family permease
LGAKYNWNPYLVGFLCGAFVGSYYSVNDVIIIMVSESSPTNLRSSAMSAEFIVAAVGYGISYVANFIVGTFLGNAYIGTLAISLLVPGYFIGLILLFAKTHETKGINMDTVTGTEWD